MEAARVLPMTAAEYFAFEQTCTVRHEFVAGEIHAMSGGSTVHNRISLNIATQLRAKLRGGPCQVFMSDVKVRLEVSRDELYYYPDVVVSCHPTGIERLFVRLPTLVVEVLSPSTESIDRREKQQNYRQAQTLEEYVMVAQDRSEVTIVRRAEDWRPQVLTAPDAVVEFRSLKQTMTVGGIYEDVDFTRSEQAVAEM